ncbi:MAG: ArsR/SmtB family transcription factor [Saccharofermentanales bacterium]
MSQVKFLDNLGYLSDLTSIFAINYNRKTWPFFFGDYDKIKDDTKFFDNLLKEFTDFPPELLMFYYLKNDSISFMTSYCYENYNEKNIFEASIDTIKEKYLDYKMLSNQLFAYYFPGEKEKFEFNYNNIDKIVDIINSSSYSTNIKYCLLSFYINPKRIVNILTDELDKKGALLTKFYERNQKLLMKLHNDFDYIEVGQILSKENSNYDFFKETIYVTTPLITINLIRTQFFPNSMIYHLGRDYKRNLLYFSSTKSLPDLDVLGRILNDKIRLEILEILLKEKEQTNSDIAKNFGLSLNMSYYHLDMMTKAGMLLERKEGKSVYYQINKQYFLNSHKAILKYA